MDIIQLWRDASQDNLARAVVSIFLLICLVLIAFYIVGWFRNLAMGKDIDSNPLAEIEKLKGEGKISPLEYQRIKQSAVQSIKAEASSTKKDAPAFMTLKEAQQKKEKTQVNRGDLPETGQADSDE